MARPQQHYEPRQVLAVKYPDRKDSTSGGMFVALSDAVLDAGGTVYGAVFDASWRAACCRADDRQGRDAMRGSKYMQSPIVGIYDQLAQDVEDGKQVLFSGTPCQCAAVDAFLQAKHLPRQQVVLVELLCTGVNSPKVWQDYLSLIAGGRSQTVQKVQFRSKVRGWKQETLQVTMDSGVYLGDSKKDPFYQCFTGSYILRTSCHSCPFAMRERGADITLGDFWAYDALPADFVDDEGISMVLVNTDLGQQLWQQVKKQTEYVVSDMPTALRRQQPLKKPVWKNKDRAKFWACYERRDLETALRRYTDLGLLTRWKKIVKELVRSLLKR